MIYALKNIIGKKVNRLFLIVWPPLGESDASQIDISTGLVFEGTPREIFKISTDKNELSSPIVEDLPGPDKYFQWSEYNGRMNAWMNREGEMEMDTEYYDVTV